MSSIKGLTGWECWFCKQYIQDETVGEHECPLQAIFEKLQTIETAVKALEEAQDHE